MFHLLSRLSRSRPLCGLATRPMIRCGAATTGSQTSKGIIFANTLWMQMRHVISTSTSTNMWLPNEKIILSTRRRPSTMKSEDKTSSFGVGFASLRASSVAPHLGNVDHGDCQSPHCCRPCACTYLDMVTEKLATCFESAMASVTDAAMPATPCRCNSPSLGATAIAVGPEHNLGLLHYRCLHRVRVLYFVAAMQVDTGD